MFLFISRETTEIRTAKIQFQVRIGHYYAEFVTGAYIMLKNQYCKLRLL